MKISIWPILSLLLILPISSSRCHDPDDPIAQFFQDRALTKHRMDVTCKQCNVKDVVELISTTAGINFIIDPEVTGTTGKLALKNCTPGHILQVICTSNNPPLALIKDNDIWRITTLDRALAYYQTANHDNDYEEKVIEVHKALFNEQFIKNVDTYFKWFLDEESVNNSYLNTGNRKFFVYAPKRVVRSLEKYVRSIDLCIPQVRIDAVIVIADRRCEDSWGFDWSGIYNRSQTIKLKKENFGFVGVGATLRDFTNRLKRVFPRPFGFNLVTKGRNFINVPFVFGGPNLNTRRLNLVLRAAEADSKLKIVSRPSVLTNNLETAEILIGNNIPIQTNVEDVVQGRLRTVDAINYKDVGTMIRVTPAVNSHDNSILLDVLIEDSQVVDFEEFMANKNRLKVPPIIKTIRTRNRVILCNGSTTVIGGLTFNKQDNSRNSVPFLARIPIIGPLFFQSYSHFNRDLEQLIFITPTVI